MGGGTAPRAAISWRSIRAGLKRCAFPTRTASWLSVLNAKRSIGARGQAEKDDSTWIRHHSAESKRLIPTDAGRRRSLLQRVARCVSDSEAEKISPGNGRSYFGRSLSAQKTS